MPVCIGPTTTRWAYFLQSFLQQEPPLASQWPLADLAGALAAARGDSADREVAPNTAEAKASITDNLRVFMGSACEFLMCATPPEGPTGCLSQCEPQST